MVTLKSHFVIGLVLFSVIACGAGTDGNSTLNEGEKTLKSVGPEAPVGPINKQESPERATAEEQAAKLEMLSKLKAKCGAKPEIAPTQEKVNGEKVADKVDGSGEKVVESSDKQATEDSSKTTNEVSGEKLPIDSNDGDGSRVDDSGFALASPTKEQRDADRDPLKDVNAGKPIEPTTPADGIPSSDTPSSTSKGCK